MVRETRHLWVGNLPDNIREDRIREHFKRYGRVQNVKLLGRMESASANASGGANSGVCATVAFMDIKSASKAHNVEHVLDERTLTTEYYEPAAIPSSAGAPSAGSSPAGSGYSGSSSSVNSAPAPVSTSRYHLSGEESAGNACAMAASAAAPATWRGTNDSATEYCRRGNTPAAYGRYQRNNSTAPYATPPSNTERASGHARWYAGVASSASGAGVDSAPSTPGGGGGGERRRRASGSGSSRSRSDSSSPEPSDTSRASTPHAPPPPHTRPTPPSHPHQWPSTANGRPLAICVRNLPTRSTDSSLKDGLYHEYKKHGKVVWVKVVGQNADRYAVVRFKKPSDVDKALEVSQDKLFFGCKISVAPHQSCDDDAESAKPYETDIDEYHPKATRTLFIGNLEKDVTQQQLREKFKHFGRIIEIDIKKGSGGGAGYAFCQYASISSVVEAIRAMDGEYVGSSRVKLGFGKPVATTCVWVDGLTEHTEKQVLGAVSRCGAATSVCVDRAAGAALVHFEQAAAAGGAVRELRRVAAMLSAAEPDHPRLCVDYASRECQEAFYEQLEKHGGSSALAGGDRLASELSGRYLPTPRHDTLRYDATGSRSRAPSFGRSTSRTPRYTHDVYDPADYAAERRYRVYEELGSSPQTDEANFEDRLQSVVVSPHRGHKHRRDSSPEERKLSKERHRSAGAGSRRSRSGSRGEKHVSRRRHRRRRDGSESRGSRASRAGTPLRDEVDVAGAPPTEPRRAPRERPPLPMSLPLPKFAVQLLRAAPSVPRVVPPPAPASPPRPPSASSSSAGSAPHSPSLEERIRSLDEKYERWTGSRAHMDAPDRARLRHRLLELDINEVKPSEVVRSLLAKRSVFDEDSERLEVATRAPSPSGSPRSIASAVPRTLRYPFPSHATQVPQPVHTPPLPDSDEPERTIDPRLNRPSPAEKTKSPDSDNNFESRLRLRTPSTDKTLHELIDRKTSPTEKDRPELAKEEKKRRSSVLLLSDECKTNLTVDKHQEKSLSDKQFENSVLMELQQKCYSIENFPCSEEKCSSEKTESRTEEITGPNSNTCVNSFEIHTGSEEKAKIQDVKVQPLQEDASTKSKILAEKFQLKSDTKIHAKSETKIDDTKTKLDTDHKKNEIIPWKRKESDRSKEKNSMSNFHKDNIHSTNYLNSLNSIELPKCSTDNEAIEGVNKEKYEINKSSNLSNEIGESHTFEVNKSIDKLKHCNMFFPFDKLKSSEIDKNDKDEIVKADRERHKSSKDKLEKEGDKERVKNKTIKLEKNEKDKKIKDEPVSNKYSGEKMKIKSEKLDKDDDKFLDKERELKHEEKFARHENHKKDKSERDRRKESDLDICQSKKEVKKEDRFKHERTKRESSDSKRDSKKEIDTKTRKSSRDESSGHIGRKDSTDSSTSKTSHDSTKTKESESDAKDDTKTKVKLEIVKLENEKNFKLFENKMDNKVKVKNEIKDEKEPRENSLKTKLDNINEHVPKGKDIDKQRHYSLDSPSAESKRKERLNSCSSLPVNIGNKRRMSSHESIDYAVGDESKKCRSDVKHERRDSKDSRSSERPKSTKFNKGHFAKLIESKTKDDKNNQVKPPDEVFNEIRDVDEKESSLDKNKVKRNHHDDMKDTLMDSKNTSSDALQNNFDFLATLELRSSEEDERQKALRKEMKEKKRIQQLQQIQELQQQADALQQAEHMNKMKDDKKYKTDDKKKEAMREKRMSTDRKSKDEKNDNIRRKSRKPTNSTDTSDSDEPKKHSIFDIIDDEPTYTMYDKVKARSCKNMQKQEEEKRQEKIKAKFSQLKQSRAKREEKKRSSWDEDSDSDHERSKTHKLSMDSSSDDEGSITQNKKREKRLSSSFDFDHSRDNDFYNSTSNDEDIRNKLSRKNSRTRIISDTSDDDMSTGKPNGPNFLNSINKDASILHKFSDSDISLKNSCEDKIKKTSLLNLFGKSDSEDNRQKLNLDVHSEFRMSYNKSFSNDFSSESESNPLHRIHSEMRRKHKKKQRKYKFLLSDDDAKNEINNIESNKEVEFDIESKYKNSEKSRRHSSKKEKRKDKMRDSFDNEREEQRDEKVKILDKKRSPNQPYDLLTEITSNSIKKEGRMEDIFGPLSDESDRESSMLHVNKIENNSSEFETKLAPNSDKVGVIDGDENRHHTDESNRRKKEKKRREKKHFTDENSLDVDAVSKAIEARLFADTSNTDDNRIKFETLPDDLPRQDQHEFLNNIKVGSEMEMLNHKHSDRLKKDSRDRKKKKKRSREDKRNRKNHHSFYHHENTDKIDNIENVELSPKVLLDIPLPTDVAKHDNPDKSDDSKSLSESPSLPRITDSPTFVTQLDDNSESKTNDDMTPNRLVVDDRIEIDFNVNETIEVDEIPMPPPIENIVQDISEVPLPKDPPINAESCKSSIPNITTDYDINKSEVDSNEDAVRSILDEDTEKQKASTESLVTKQDKKVEEKPRAVISQEETEDAVAALLGESFSGNVNTFPNCYEKVEVDTTHQTEIECTVIENEVIPEEDAEEMRQAVQNLNACEMEMKPDTPVSDNDLLLIDTDTEENEDNTQDAIERLPVNIIATNQSLNNNNKTSVALSSEVSSIIASKPQITEKSILPIETNVENKPEKDTGIKPQIVKKDAADQATSTATPVITSWTLSNKKLIEPRVINIPAPQVPSGENESKTTHITANIVQIKSPQNQTVKINNTIRPTLSQSRLSAPYQVINQVIRPQVSNINMQPPTIKIPESHVIYQKPQAIVISPRLTGNDPRLQSPKSSPQADGMTSPRLTNMTIINTKSPQNINSVGMSSPPAVQQRSPGQVTVVRMQQPPLSPIHTMHLPPGARAMVSPNRPNSVLVQTQGAPIHLNRLPVTPVLAPITKHLGNGNNLIQAVPKSSGVNTSPIIHQQKIITGECRKPEGIADNSKIILSPTRLQHNTSTNPTILAQNRLISMQSAINVGNLNTALHLTNKVLVNNKNLLAEKRENQFYKSENLPSFVPNSILQVANVNHSNASIIQGGTKPVMCNTQDPSQLSRGQVSNVIHSINSQRLVTSSPISTVLQLDTNKGPSVLSIAPVRSTSILTKSENSTPVITTSSLTNVVMTPLLLKTNTSPKATIRLHPRSEGEIIENKVSVALQSNQNDSGIRLEPKNLSRSVEIKNPIPKSPEHNISPTKCETDFEELLKDNTNEIKVTNDPNKKLEINVGKSVTTVVQNLPKKLEDKSNEEKELVPSQESKEKSSVIISDTLQNESKKSPTVDTQMQETVQEITPENILPQKVEEVSKELSSHTIVNNPISVNINFTNKEDKNELQNHKLETPDKETEDKKVETYLWSANDVNIESVIKKVDSLCNDTQEDKKHDTNIASEHLKDVEINNDTKVSALKEKSTEELKDIDKNKGEPPKNQDALQNEQSIEDQSNERVIITGKRGGRSSRGKKTEKNQDRVLARKITKPARGMNSSKRGRGRCKVDKKTKDLVNSNPNNIPGDVYDFHEDSGDESSTSNKNEARPRLILTIKSPLSGNTGATPTSTLSITPKEQNIKVEKPKEEKSETFASPSTNTRKSRRLQEKDIQRTTVDDVIDDVIKNSTMMCKNNKEPNKKRPIRQVTNKTNTDKNVTNDTRKSPRGTKRPRNRSLSDASMDSNEEAFKKDDTLSEPKIMKVSETPAKPAAPEPEQLVTKPTNIVPPVTSCPPVNPTPIMKPPKKMISEISAKLACTFDTAVNVAPKAGGASPTVPERLGQFMPDRLEAEKHNPIRDARMDQSNVVENVPVATGEVISGGISADAALGRRLVDNVPTNMTPVGATEATDARVQSPALPHRPPSTHRATDRATPILIRGGDSDIGTGVGGGNAGAGASRGFRGAYPGPASLPRGAHHPAHHPAHAPPKPLPPIGAHHPPASRVTLTSVPAISPQGQMPMGDGMYAHFSHQHYQMYQQHFRATQHENRATPTHFTRTLEAEGSEAPTSPLELRRPPSARVPRPAHSPAPADRHNIMYGVRCGRSPPPAHGTSRPPAALPPATPGPPHASQVPREADSLQMLLRRYPVMWQGLLALKNDSAAVQMHFVGGNPGVAADALSRNSDGSPASLLRIAQRMRLEPAQLDQVHRKMKLELEHCILLALPCGRDHMDVLQQSTNLSAGFITYLQRKMAAGIVNVAPTPGHQQSMYTVHIFPSCDFANENLTRIAPDLMHRVANIAHLLIVIATAIV